MQFLSLKEVLKAYIDNCTFGFAQQKCLGGGWKMFYFKTTIFIQQQKGA